MQTREKPNQTIAGIVVDIISKWARLPPLHKLRAKTAKNRRMAKGGGTQGGHLNTPRKNSPILNQVFSDICRDFHAFSMEVMPRKVARILNHFFSDICREFHAFSMEVMPRKKIARFFNQVFFRHLQGFSYAFSMEVMPRQMP